MATGPILQQLEQDLQDPDPDVRVRALLRAPRSRNADEALAPIVVRSLRDSHPWVRLLASEVLRDTGAPSSLLPQMLPSLHDPDLHVRQNLVMLLGTWPAHPETLRAAIPLFSDSEPLIRILAARPVWRCSGDLALIHDVVQQALHSDDSGVLCQACHVLAEMGKEGTSFLPDLAALTTHPHAAVRGNALHALIQCSTDGTSLREVTAWMADDEDALVVWVLSKLRLRLDNPS